MTKTETSWNLGNLYESPDDPKLKNDLESADTLIQELKTYRSKITSLAPTQLLQLIQTWEDLTFLLHKVGLFADLLESTHIGDATITRFSKKIDETLVAKGQEIIFLEVELSRLSDEQWHTYLNSKDLKPYHAFLKVLSTEAKHTLSEAEEKILAEKNQTSTAALRHLFKITTDTLTFDWEGQSLTLDEISAKMRDPEREIRKKAFLTLHSGLQTNTRTTPALYNTLLQDKAIADRLRHYDYPEQARYQSDEVDKPTIEALVTAVENGYTLVQRYYALKKQILQLETVYWWDRYAPLPRPKKTISVDEGKQLVIDTFATFHPRFAEIAQTMMKQEHIDWLPSPTKRGGAFCAMTGRTLYPYVLLNYTTELDDVMTLAHELGHAIHDVLAQESNTFLETHPSLALAEIASTFGELIVFDRLITSDTSIEDQKALLMSAVEDNIATVFRQITMFQFEQHVHTERRAKGELSAEELDTIWQTTMTKPFGNTVTFTEEHKNFWMYIPHIINTPFYVYSYAFAQLCSLALFQTYKAQGQPFVEKYLALLQAGGSLSPKDNLAQAGFDITQPGFWQQGLRVIEDYITQLEKLAQTS